MKWLLEGAVLVKNYKAICVPSKMFCSAPPLLHGHPHFLDVPPIPKLVVLIFHPQKNGGEIAPPKFWGYGLTGLSMRRRRSLRRSLSLRRRSGRSIKPTSRRSEA